jgi:hypothetical protein
MRHSRQTAGARPGRCRDHPGAGVDIAVDVKNQQNSPAEIGARTSAGAQHNSGEAAGTRDRHVDYNRGLRRRHQMRPAELLG